MLTFENKHFSFSLDKKTGKVISVINKYNGEEINREINVPYFIYETSQNDEIIIPKNLELKGNKVNVTFENDTNVDMIVSCRDNHITFEIDSDFSDGVKSLTFANLNVIPCENYLLNGIAMAYFINPFYFGYRHDASETKASVYSVYPTGLRGAKMGVVFSEKKDAIPYLQELTDTIDPNIGIVSKAGGAYARSWKNNSGDYVFVMDTNPEKIDEVLDLARSIDVDQLDIHQSHNTVRQGDFRFAYTENGTPEEFYEKFVKKFKDQGFIAGLHTYAYYIDYLASGILSNPKWQKDLETLESYTLKEDIDEKSTSLLTNENAENFNLSIAYFAKNSNFVLVDEEIIHVTTVAKEGLTTVVRGFSGTKPAPHKKGAVIKHLSGFFNLFTPVLGSELFYHIADLTANAYNKGGFDMIYLDAIDGLRQHTPKGEEAWFYFHSVVHRIISQCERSPVFETSSEAPQEWNARGRMGAWDTVNRSIKKFIRNHMNANIASINKNMEATLGWFDFCPDLNDKKGKKNTINKTLFHDDLDYLGMGSLLYNMGVVYNPFNPNVIKSNPFNYDNIRYYVDTYAKLRKSHYFNDEVLQKVRALNEKGVEFKVVKKDDGSYAFVLIDYQSGKVDSLSRPLSFKGKNTQKAQVPFVRIESRASALLEEGLQIADYNPDISLSEQSLLSNGFTLDMRNKMAIKTRIRGTGKDGDALLFAVSGNDHLGQGVQTANHFFVDLNFEGWKDFIFIDSDCADYDTEKYKFEGVTTTFSSYNTFRFWPNFSAIQSLTIIPATQSSLEAHVDKVLAFDHTISTVENPTLVIGRSSISFKATISSGEFIEYDPITNKAILYHNDTQTKEEIEHVGNFNVEQGDFVCYYSAKNTVDAPIRAKVVLGFSGEEFKN